MFPFDIIVGFVNRERFEELKEMIGNGEFATAVGTETIGSKGCADMVIVISGKIKVVIFDFADGFVDTKTATHGRERLGGFNDGEGHGGRCRNVPGGIQKGIRIFKWDDKERIE
tara:strand:+ start:352 stop:693 length:342 start_codon:yes stop_codon:yes gene_type:complete